MIIFIVGINAKGVIKKTRRDIIIERNRDIIDDPESNLENGEMLHLMQIQIVLHQLNWY